MQSSRFCISLCLFLFASICTNHAFSKSEADDDSYSKHCSAIIPRYNITARSSDDFLPSLSTPYFTGGGSLLRIDPDRSSYYVDKNLRLRLQPDYYRTTSAGVYKVHGFLYIQSSYNYDDVPANYSDGGYSRRRNRASGSLESTASANDQPYFDPILIFSFLEVSNYKYSLVTEEIRGVFPSRKDESSRSRRYRVVLGDEAAQMSGLGVCKRLRGASASPLFV